MSQNSYCIFVFFLILFSSIKLPAQYKVSGSASDRSTGESLPGAKIIVTELGKSFPTDVRGRFTINLPAGSYTLEIDYIGFKGISRVIQVPSDVSIDLMLDRDNQQLDEVIVTSPNTGSNKAIAIKKPQMSTNKLTTEEIKKMPVMLGEVDILKSILQLPGVTNAGEGSSGFNVRGGAADQNLVLLDQATVLSSSHLLGLFSVFNADVIEDLTLYKGGAPAAFGGRASSVLDIRSKQVATERLHLNGGIGLLSSRLMVESQFAGGKGAVIAAGRSSYAHLLLRLTGNDNSAYFYDLNAKVDYDIDQNNRISFSTYHGIDVFSVSRSFNNDYGNTFLNLQWKHKISDRVSSNMAFIQSAYNFNLQIDAIGMDWKAGIASLTYKYDFDHLVSKNYSLQYGLNAQYHNFNPGTLENYGSSTRINAEQLDKKYAVEPSLYIQATQQLSPKINISYGVRLSSFFRMGEQHFNLYDGNPVAFNMDFQIYEAGLPTSTQYFGSGQVIDRFVYPEPRLGLSYQLHEDESIKASYNRMAQFLHLISNTNSPTPLDVWAPSDRYLKPQIADQVALGYFRNFQHGKYSLEVEGYYKTVQNRLDYIDGANLIGNNAIEQVALSGTLRAYGLEVLLRKNSGRLSGWLSYTLSTAQQQIPGRTDEETGINNGQWYATNYDKPHNIAITAFYRLSDKWSMGANFTYQTGRPVTYPEGQYAYSGVLVPVFGLRNGNRLPDFHHLDLSFSYVPKPESTKKWKGEWVFSIYNVYNRQNTASMSFRQNEDTNANESVRLSIFGFIPAVTYNFKF